MTPDQVQSFMAIFLQGIADEFKQDARDETQSSVASALNDVGHRLESSIDDLGFYMSQAMGETS